MVIGAGPAGEKGAAKAAYYGKRVALIERAPYLGGAGINTGTVPSKTLRETALYFSGLRQRGLYGLDYSLKEHVTVAELMYRQKAVVESEQELVEGNLRHHAVETYRGTAKLRDAHNVIITAADGSQQELES